MSGGDWIQALAAFDRRGEACVLVTVTAAAGSTPRAAGTKMLVGADSLHGTIGGGALEFAAVETARAMLDRGEATLRSEALPLGPKLGQCCGGHVTLLLEPILPPRLRVLLFGAGHVAKALVTVLGTLPCRIVWVDSRAAEFPASLPDNVTALCSDQPLEQIARHQGFTHLLIMTHDHALDYQLTRAGLQAGGFAYVGLIGSATKRARFLSRLARDGVVTGGLTCPIGLPSISGKHPGEIAVAVAAEILASSETIRIGKNSGSIVTNDMECSSCFAVCEAMRPPHDR
ncbi:xanthine dehydrogenase accessory protein XdhC [Niveispirillum sp. SYP-B3756]|uniref:xanthine dehydrogenase accessory protein XdhC n=1 Tax=Niveispirillum sp. SYP-B3756 TaxID=2662178 RepID=UPI001291F5CF|nr:xanthine dehydrogenase accessory protein XdhC [Niveispirillum sp. SYP-B3756]MQP64873.1 xanthine dehydrogenase accessory protein XdhC [Niveispirillum sp. SYP-B3756]